MVLSDTSTGSVRNGDVIRSVTVAPFGRFKVPPERLLDIMLDTFAPTETYSNGKLRVRDPFLGGLELEFKTSPAVLPDNPSVPVALPKCVHCFGVHFLRGPPKPSHCKPVVLSYSPPLEVEHSDVVLGIRTSGLRSLEIVFESTLAIRSSTKSIIVGSAEPFLCAQMTMSRGTLQ